MNYSKRLLHFFTALLLSLHTAALAGSGGPDAFGYSWQDSENPGGPAYSWVDIALPENQVSASPVATIDLETPIVFYGEVETRLRVSQHGYLSTLLSDPGDDNTFDCPLPATPSSGGGNRIYPLHGNYRDGGIVHYKYIPRAAHPSNRCGAHVISWSKMVNEDLDTPPVEFQVLLFDNFDILFQINTDGITRGQASTTGILRAGNTQFLSIACNTASSIPDDYAVLITPPVVNVTSTDDTFGVVGVATLRDALDVASNGTRINLTGVAPGALNISHPDPLLVAKSVAIENRSGVANFSIDGGDTRRCMLILDIFQANHCFISGVHFRDGGDRAINTTESLTLFGCSVTSSSSTTTGGGIFSNDVLYLTDSNISNNTCDTDPGGGAAARAVHARGCAFTTNETTGGSNTDGGAFHLPDAGRTSTFDDCIFVNNASTRHGGAIWAGEDHTVILTDCIFDGNNVETNSDRGGALALAGADLTATRCLFFENEGGFRGGAIYSTGDPFIDLDNCAFDSNTAITGGAIHLQGAGLKMDHCSVVRNSTTAISLSGGSPVFTCGNSLFANNVDGDGGELAISLGLAVYTSTGPNLSDADEEGFNVGDGDIENTEANIRTDVPGGELLPGSPAIDAGFGFHPADELDARRRPRIEGPDADIGAYEYHSTVVVDTTTDDEGEVFVTEVNPNGMTTLRAALSRVGHGGTLTFASGLSGQTINVRGLMPAPVPVTIDASSLTERITLDGSPDTTSELRLPTNSSVTGLNFTGFHIYPLLLEGAATITDCDIIDNNRIMAVLSNNSGSNQTIRIERCRISNNGPSLIPSSEEFVVGGDNHFQLIDSVIENTVSVSDGGAILFPSRIGNVDIINSSIVRNSTSGSGGALHFSSGGSGNVKITNSTISSNESERSYGSIFGNDIDLEVYRCTIAANRCSSGDTVRLEGRSTGEIGQSIFQGNSEGFNVANFGSLVTSNGWNIIDTDDLTSPTATDMVNRKAHIAPLGYYSPDNDYLMPVHALLSFSPAIDSGQAVTGDPAFDNRRAQRIADGDGDGSAAIDRGAFEAMAPVYVTDGLDGNPGALRQAIADAPPGGRVLFDPSLDGTQLFLNSQIVIPHSVQIDATSLPNGYVVSGNNATRIMWMDSNAHLAVHAITLRNGSTGTNMGGTAFRQRNGHSLFSNCALIFNEGESGVGAYIDEGSSYFLNCTIAQNVCGGLGAAMNFRPNSTGRIEHCTIANNSSDSRGNIVLSTANVTAKYTLFSNNTRAGALDTFSWDNGYDTGTFSLGNNIADENMPASFLNQSTDSDDNSTLPLEPIGSNGGWCLTIAVTGSPIIDSASVNDSPPYPTFDARGFIRRASKFTRIDAGAFEAGGDTQDSDEDQMPDWWECRFGLIVFSPNTLEAGQDPDGDEFTNLEEFQNGTDPLTPEELIFALPEITGVARRDTNIRLLDIHFIGSPGTAAFLETSTDLIDWTPTEPEPVEFNGSAQTKSISLGNGEWRYLRFRRP